MSVIIHNGKPATCLKCGKKCTFGGRNQPVSLENKGRIQELENLSFIKAGFEKQSHRIPKCCL